MSFVVRTHAVAVQHTDDAVLMKRHRLFVVLLCITKPYTRVSGTGNAAAFNPDDLSTVNFSFGKQE